MADIKQSIDEEGPGSIEDPRKDSMPGPRKDSAQGPKNDSLPSSRKGSMAGPRKSSTVFSRKSSKAASRKGSMIPKVIDLDDVLVNELGQFGRFQMYNILLVAVPIIMSAFMSEYIFSAAAVPHRCRIPECGENNKSVSFSPNWISYAIPKDSSCRRFESVGEGTLDSCPAELFNNATQLECDGFVYERENSVVYEFDLGCQEWMRALAGTLNSVGTLLVLPITGYVSDRFGRRVALVISVFNLGLVGLIRAFSINYPMYLILHILQTTVGAGTFSSAYIFAAELVGPKYRVLTSAIASSMFAVGQVILGAVAWAVQPWRYMIMTLHIPCFLIIAYYWLLTESVRWLLSKQKFEEARMVLEKVARVNKKTISEKSMQGLLNPPATVESIELDKNKPSLIKAIVSSPILLRRICTTPIWWITTTLVFYGLSINSNGLSANIYLNYILTCAIEIPGYFFATMILDRIGRKPTLFGGYMLSAACNLSFAFIPTELAVLRTVVYLLGKFGIAVVMTSLYLYTSELYPTEYRHTLLAFSSMIGRIGSITAPLTPPLADYWEGIPSVMFGTMALLSGVLVLTQPETLGTRMPDTLAEAEMLGTKESKARRTNA